MSVDAPPRRATRHRCGLARPVGPGRAPASPAPLADFGRGLSRPSHQAGRAPASPAPPAAGRAPASPLAAPPSRLGRPCHDSRGAAHGPARRLAAALLAALCVLAALALSPARAQGYAGLGEGGSDYAPVTPGRDFSFPEDHGPHAGFRIEWWYVTADLEGPDGTAYGVQWTLFRQAISPDPAADGWGAPQVWMGHAAVTTPSRHLTAEKFGRGGIGQAGVRLDPFQAWIDAWRFESLSDGFSPLRLSAGGPSFAFDLALEAHGPLVLQGDRGYSRKSQRAQASYYYSQPFFGAVGEIVIDGEPVRVTGRAWLDREWSSQPLDEDQEGWDWFSLHLPEGEKLMLYRLRHANGDDWHASSWIGADGTVEPLTGEAVLMRPLAVEDVAGRKVPVEWELEVPSHDLKIRTAPVNPNAWMPMAFPYWEGPIRFEGTHEGVGYLEMTGY